MKFKARYKSCLWSKTDIWGGLLKRRNSFLRVKWDRIIGTLISKKRRRHQRLCKDYRLVKPSSRPNQPYKFPRWAFRNSLSNRLCLRRFYGDLSSKTVQRLCRIKKNKKFIRSLESRLDINLYRLGFLGSVYESKQAILHGKVLVNGRKITFDQFLLQSGDIVEFSSNFRSSIRSGILSRRCGINYVDRLRVHPTPDWLHTDYCSLSFIFVGDITFSMFYPFRVEFDEIRCSSRYKY
uniref:Ribosomal protein S4 n=1 Tax=Dictyopteris divaricata TaxID=156996 RepID=A0A4Y5T8N1_9PHAE|nr:ribosomal protein S4 [Dictyopteris divaricata]QDB64114.1 ribosomal protein S4 [Dictyopteris divaricata]